MARAPYLIARQEWLGDALDDLTDRRVLAWRWEYDTKRSRAIYLIGLLAEQQDKRYDTRQAEALVQRLYDELDVPWKPVPHPGGEQQLQQVREQLGRTAL